MKITGKQINEIIDSNTDLFTKGTVISFNKFKKLFKGIKGNTKLTNKTIKGSLEIVNLYAYSMNSALKRRGLYMKAQDFYTSFLIIENPEAKVTDYRKRAQGHMRAAGILETGIKHHKSVWSPLTPTEEEAVTIAGYHSFTTNYR